MAEDLIEILDFLPDREDEALAERRFRTPEFCVRLLERVDELRLRDASSALAPARFAIRIAARCSDVLFGQAWAAWARVHRTLSNAGQAEIGQRMVRLYLEDPFDGARWYRLEAYELRDEGRFEAAKGHALQALTSYLAAGDTHLRGCALADLGTVHLAEKDPDAAARRLIEALRYIDPNRDPRYHQYAVHHLAAALGLIDRPDARLEAAIAEIRRRRYIQGLLPWMQHRWLEGLVFKGRGRRQRAEATLQGAKNQLLAFEAVCDGGMAAMDLAGHYLATGEWEKGERLAQETVRALESLGIDSETLAEVRLYAEAAGDRSLTQDRIDQLWDAFRQLSQSDTVRP